MGIASDKSSRDRATPFNINIWGYNRGPLSGRDIAEARNQGDLRPLTLGESAIIPVRFLLSQYNLDLAEAYLSLHIATSGPARQLRLAFGRFAGGDPDPINREVETEGYSSLYFDQSHSQITGSDQPFSLSTSNDIILRHRQLAQAIRGLTPPYVYQDAFALLFVFSDAPGTLDVTDLKILASGEVAPR